jgi:CubicO group peptidase (beta-lactamase class C family)
MLASHLVSVLANESFPSFVARRIFKPLGMKHSSFDPENVREDLVTHAWVGSPVDRRVPSLFSPQIARLVAGAGVGVSSAEDMSHWVGALLNALASKSEPPKDEVLPSAVLREVTRPQSLVGDGYVPSGLEPLRTTYGKGWFQDNYRGHRVR